MIKSLKLIKTIKRKKDIPENEAWLKHLKYTEQKSYNLRNVEDLSMVSNKSVLNYVVRTLEALEKNIASQEYSKDEIKYVENTLKWSEVAKCGNKTDRTRWTKKGYDLFVHNLASAEIYKDSIEKPDEITYILIKTHGMIGQYTKGEVNLDKNSELTNLVFKKKISKEKLERILILLNRCILEGISEELYQKVKEKINSAINNIVNNEYGKVNYSSKKYILDRMKNIFKDKSKDEFELLKE